MTTNSQISSGSVRLDPLVRVEGTSINDGVIRVEKLACGHLTSRLAGERRAQRRRCSKCTLGLPQEWDVPEGVTTYPPATDEGQP